MATRPLREVVRREGDQEILACGHAQVAPRRRAMRRRCRACAEANLPSRYEIVRVADDSEAVCPYCKDTMAGAQAVTCSGCRAQLCALCVAEVSACPVFGCRRPFVARGGTVPITAKPRVTVTVPAVVATTTVNPTPVEDVRPYLGILAEIGPRGMGVLTMIAATAYLSIYALCGPGIIWLGIAQGWLLGTGIRDLRTPDETPSLGNDLQNLGGCVATLIFRGDVESMWRRYHQHLDALVASDPPPVDPELPWRRGGGTIRDRV